MTRRRDPNFEPSAGICKGCGNPCETVQIDKGHGPVDNPPGDDVDFRVLSACCNADVLDYDDEERSRDDEPHVN